MTLETTPVAGAKWMFITGWILSAIPILMMGPLAIMFALMKMDMVRDGAVKQGYQAHHAPIIIALEITCAVIYAIPRTAVLGAILMTGYLGGAVATHLRIDDPAWVVPLLFGVVVWLGLFLREPRLRALLPLRS